MLTVIKGCMFAGKTKELLELYRKDEGKKALYKPRLDNRSGTQYVSTHDGVFILLDSIASITLSQSFIAHLILSMLLAQLIISFSFIVS